jgi:hypothetical protein
MATVNEKFTVQLQGKTFVTFEGLLNLFHENGGQKITTKLIQADPYLFKAMVVGELGTFTAHGDADEKNVNSMIARHKIRMAETRAIARALRLYCNIGMTSLEEIGGDEKENA